MLVFFAFGNAKVRSFALGDAKVPNANGFASQWNIGLRGTGVHSPCKLLITFWTNHDCCRSTIIPLENLMDI